MTPLKKFLSLPAWHVAMLVLAIVGLVSALPLFLDAAVAQPGSAAAMLGSLPPFAVVGAVVWSGVQIALQSAIGSAQVVSGITKANPGVVTYVGSDPSSGDYVLLSDVVGMYQVNDRVVRAANVNTGANTLEMESVDSTSFDTFTSGNMYPLTFGTSLAVVAGVTVSGGDFNQIDITTIHDNVNKQQPGNASPLVLNFSCLWDPSDAGLVALKAASDIKAKRALRVTFSNNYRVLLYGYVGCTLFPTGSAQQRVETPVVFTSFGKVQAYTS